MVSILAAIWLGIPFKNIPKVIDKGIGDVLGDLTLVIVLGAMLGKLVAVSGGAKKIADVMVGIFGTKRIQWGLMVTGFIVGIPLFYGIGFILLVPIIFSVAYQYKLSAVYIGLPMLTSLSVAHGFLPPHPSPVALISIFKADMGRTLILGILIALPTIIIAGPLFSRTLKNIKAGPMKFFEAEQIDSRYSVPGKLNSFITATLPVFLLIIFTVVQNVPMKGSNINNVFSFIGAPSIVMFSVIVVATYTLGIKQGRSMSEVMGIYGDAAKDITGILLIIAGSGIFKNVMETSGVSKELALTMKNLPIPPLVLGWMIAGILRACIGSATVAALTAAGIILPLAIDSGVDPSLMTLSIGSGSLMFSHINDSGFWLFKEYFNLNIKDTLRSWTLMETIISVIGLAGVLILNEVL